MPAAEVAVIGGSGFDRWLGDAQEVRPHTPYGPPSAPIALTEVGGRGVAFLPRHGRDHEIPPHRINYRANLWALHSLGVRRVIAPCAVGSLRADVHPGELVVPDQLVDRTSARADTYLDGPAVGHVSFADPYCPELSGILAAEAEGGGHRVHRGGTTVVISGPRFSTRAESRWYRSMGADIINMTQYPEASLARELGCCYAAVAMVTDYDTGVEGDPGVAPVTMDQVLRVLTATVAVTREVLAGAIPAIPAMPTCACAAGGSPHLA